MIQKIPYIIFSYLNRYGSSLFCALWHEISNCLKNFITSQGRKQQGTIDEHVLTKDKSFVSDENGICKFQIDKFPTKLNISYIGYDDLTYTLTNQSDESIYIDLSPKATTLI